MEVTRRKKVSLVQSLERYPKCSSWRSSGMEINHQGTHNLFVQRLNPQVSRKTPSVLGVINWVW
jgi:hypothetical protein